MYKRQVCLIIIHLQTLLSVSRPHHPHPSFARGMSLPAKPSTSPDDTTWDRFAAIDKEFEESKAYRSRNSEDTVSSLQKVATDHARWGSSDELVKLEVKLTAREFEVKDALEISYSIVSNALANAKTARKSLLKALKKRYEVEGGEKEERMEKRIGFLREQQKLHKESAKDVEDLFDQLEYSCRCNPDTEERKVDK